jgi:hypothetical protein
VKSSRSAGAVGHNCRMSPVGERPPKWVVDARTFQHQLSDLTETLALKVQREGHERGLKPKFVALDIFFLLKQAQQTYRLFFFINAEKRRKEDVDWVIAYSIVILPLVRTMIDCLYNITAILANPAMGYQYRQSGYKLSLKALEVDERRYGGNPVWDEHIAKSRAMVLSSMRTDGIAEMEVRASKTWPTLSAYLRIKKTAVPTPHQEFLRKLTFGFWREYSGMAHATFEGVFPVALYLAPKEFPHDERPRIDAASESLISLHVSRVAAVLLCTLTEIQAHFRFDGARINDRLRGLWSALVLVPEIKELYDERYAAKLQEQV